MFEILGHLPYMQLILFHSEIKFKHDCTLVEFYHLVHCQNQFSHPNYAYVYTIMHILKDYLSYNVGKGDSEHVRTAKIPFSLRTGIV